MRKINSAGLKLIKAFEGLKLKAYLDIVGIPTLGYGITEGVTKEDVVKGRTITEQQAVDMLMKELSKFEAGVESCVNQPINENQFSALVCFAYNVGIGALQKSTLLRMLNLGVMDQCAAQFLRWNKAGGKEIAGLTRRRQAEQALFLTPVNSTSIPTAPIKDSKDLLSDGPSDEDIEKKLKDIEKDIT